MTYDTTSPNGILLSQDERTVYVAQSDYDGVRELRAYPILDDGGLGVYTVLHQFGQDSRGVQRGVDGMCLDTEGNIIACAGWREMKCEQCSMKDATIAQLIEELAEERKAHPDNR